MNRFNTFFGRFNDCDNITVKGGSFVLKSGKSFSGSGNSKRYLYVVYENIGEERLLNANIRSIVPFGDNGVACETYYPLGDRQIILYFFVGNGIKTESGYILNDKRMVYTYRDGLRLNREPNGNYDLILTDEQMKRRGYEGKLYFYDECFGIPTASKELISYFYYNYDGSLNKEYKELKIAREIMKTIGSFISFGYDEELGEEEDDEISNLTWEAKSATADDALRLIKTTEKCNKLDKAASEKIIFIIEQLTEKGAKDCFTRFMELLFMALKISSGRDEWIKISVLKNKSEKETKEAYERYTKINSIFEKHICEIATRLINNPDFEFLLFEKRAFANAFERIVNEEL